MRSKRNAAITVVVGLGLLLPALAIEGLSAVRRSPRAMPGASTAAPWSPSLAAVDEALGRRDVSAAMVAWHSAHGTALRDRRWEGLVEVGDARMRIERAAGFERNGREQARLLYMMALFRARDAGSVDGALRVATAFAALGDREVAAQAVQVAARLERP